MSRQALEILPGYGYFCKSGPQPLEEKTMPTYVYRCDQCGEEFSRIMSFKEYEETKVACPKCKSAEVKQQLTEFIARTSRKS